MSDPYEKIFPGEPIGKMLSAGKINMLIDAGKFARLLTNVSRGMRPVQFDTAVQSLTVFVTGRVMSTGHISGLSMPKGWRGYPVTEWVHDAARNPVFQATSPTEGQPFAILAEPIEDMNSAARAVVSGLAFTFVRKVTDDQPLYDYADAWTNETEYLKSVPHGPARVLYAIPYGTRTYFALVRLDYADRQAVVRVDSYGESSGVYHGRIQNFDPSNRSWSNSHECYVIDVNG